MSAGAPRRNNVTVDTEREIVVTRVFDVPRARVFEAWTRPERLMRWWGPNGFRVPGDGGRRRAVVRYALWIVQVLLAALFVFAGGMKLAMPIGELTRQVPLPGWFIRFVAVAEVLGGLGLILPGLLRIATGLTPLAALGLVVIMIGATVMSVPLGIGLALIPLAVGLLLVFVAWGRWRLAPADFRVARSATIAAPASAVFARVNDFHEWKAWNPWTKLDAAMTETYEGVPAGVGAVYTWAGNGKVGQGRMTLTESRPGELIRIRLEFLRPLAATNTAEFSFRPEGGRTVVTWSMAGRHTTAGKAMSQLMSMDRMIGGQFEKGLADLRAAAESAARK